ncbi:EGF-like domain protein, partial [Ostertagia ostertagi]
IPAHPAVHVSSQFQSDSQPSLLILKNDGSIYYSDTGSRRMPSCHYESFFNTPFTCAEPLSYFTALITIKTSETTVQRAQRAYCFFVPDSCLNGGSPNEVPGVMFCMTYGSCSCPTNFNGANCEHPICLNGATEKDYECICAAGYIGQFCQF